MVDALSASTGILSRRERLRLPHGGRLTKAGRIAYWKGYNREAQRWELKWRAEMRHVFEDQRIQVRAKIRRWRQLKASALPEGEIDRALLDTAEWNVILAGTGRKLGEAVMIAGGNGFLRDFAIVGVSFELDSPGVREALDERYGDPRSNLVGTWPGWINDTTNTVLRRQLADEFAEQAKISISTGESIGRFEERVETVFGQAKSYRTQRIARTETLGAYSKANHVAMSEAGAPGREWIHVTPEDYRLNHRAIDGQIRPIDKPFDLFGRRGAVQMMHPQQFGAPAAEVVNCRCTTAPVWDKEEIAEAMREAA